MIHSIAILLAIASPEPEPTHPALAAFDQLCGDSKSVSDVVESAIGLGWNSYTPAEGSQHARLASELARVPSDKFEVGLQILQSPSKRISIFALEVISPNGEGIFECKVNDDSASRPTDAEFIEWAGMQPTNRRGEGSSEVLEWAPSHLSAPRVVAAYHVPIDINPRWPGIGLIVTSLHFYEIN